MKLHLPEKDTLWRDIIQWFVLILASVTVICVSIILILNACGVFEGTRVDFPMALLAFAVFAITSVIFAAVLRGILQPLRDLYEATRKIEHGDYHVQVRVPGTNNSIKVLIESFNRMAQELNNIDLFRNDFINHFSHEFKTPIVSIHGFANRLVSGNLTEQQKQEYAQLIAAESERLAGMASNVLLLSRYENQEIVTEQTDFSLDEQLRLCVLAQQERWMAKAMEPDMQLEPVTIRSNEDMLQQVWTNLIDNAIKFSPAGSSFSVRCAAQNGQVQVEVADHGCGMSEATMRFIFDKFYQGDPAHQQAGNGLGLSIVKRIVTICGGTIQVRSAPGAGAVFTVTLPMRQEDGKSV